MKYPHRAIWTAFLTFKSQLNALKTPKNERVIEFIQNVDFDPREVPIPDREVISKKTGVPRGKVVEILRILYPQLIERLLKDECKVSKVTQFICIEGSPSDQRRQDQKNTTHSEKSSADSITFNCNLCNWQLAMHTFQQIRMHTI